MPVCCKATACYNQAEEGVLMSHRLEKARQYRHLLLCLFWVVYGIVFTLIERYLTAESYYPMHCALDDWMRR